ncbi:MAG: site-specific DNA-methyltransferase [Bacillota bacterium]|jgi:adenine-specific DNA-methyltransferase
MAVIKNLLQQITDPVLRERLTEEVNRLSKNKKFGLVFEEHVPECTPLYSVPIKQGSFVARKTGKMNNIYIVKEIDDETAICMDKITFETEAIPLGEIVSVAQFGEPIFPSLEPIDKVLNAADDSLWHTIIEADNYHALQLLEYLYEGKVDCIYIDPPYNTGARDWKYNNDYVDSNDAYRHSKWLSMMKKRLKLAHRILNPETGVLIVTIDEHEVHHLRTLLEEIFPGFYIQMVTYVSNPTGATQGRFSRVEEYAVYCFAPSAFVPVGDDSMLGEIETSKKVRWKSLLRSGTSARREDRKNMFYPVYIDVHKGIVVDAGSPLPYEESPDFSPLNGLQVAWPIRTDGSFGRWSVGVDTFRSLIKKGYVSLGRFDSTRNTWGITYISDQTQKMIANGRVIVTGKNENTGVVTIEYADAHNQAIRTVWYRTMHNAGAYGTDLLSNIIGQSRTFSFPKSVYATKDSINAVMRDKKDALIVDFFAGSGTTLHAVNLLNAEDDGKRRCILVTNNEVSEAEARELKAAGYQPGDPEWESRGICRSVTWPRTEYSILGKRADGTILTGEYFTNLTTDKEVNRSFYQLGFVEDPTRLVLAAKKQIVALMGKNKLPQSLVKADSRFVVSEKYTASILFDSEAADEWLEALEDQEHITDFYIVAKENRIFNEIKTKVVELLGTITVTEPFKRPMSEGFAANVEYFKLGFLDKNSVSLGQQFHEILPLLWLKAGAVGERPELDGIELPDMLILPQNSFAILLDEDCYGKFSEDLLDAGKIETVYFVTNSEEAFREMSDGIEATYTYQLYRDYIDNFVIGSRRNSL